MPRHNYARYSECGEDYASLGNAYPQGMTSDMCNLPLCQIPTNAVCSTPSYSNGWSGWGQGGYSNGYGMKSGGYGGWKSGSSNSNNTVRSCAADGRVKCDRF